jgi:hypothetical protein
MLVMIFILSVGTRLQIILMMQNTVLIMLQKDQNHLNKNIKFNITVVNITVPVAILGPVFFCVINMIRGDSYGRREC